MIFGLVALVLMIAGLVLVWDAVGQPTKPRHWRRLWRNRRNR